MKSKSEAELFIQKFEKEERRKFESKLKKQIKDAKALFKQAEQSLRQNKEVKAIVTVGTTPEWNDGEECVHSEESFLLFHDGTYNHAHTIIDFAEQVLEEEVNPSTENPFENKSVIKRFEDKFGKLLASLLLDCEYKINKYKYNQDEYFSFKRHKKRCDIVLPSGEEAFGTNFLIVFLLKDDQLVIGKEDYECGW